MGNSALPSAGKPPLSLALVGWLFVAVGLGGIGRHGWTWLHAEASMETVETVDFALAGGSGALALLGGAFLLRRQEWARWVLAAWMAAHVGISALHETEKLVVHVAIFVPISWLLFRPPATAWIRGGGSAPPCPPPSAPAPPDSRG